MRSVLVLLAACVLCCYGQPMIMPPVVTGRAGENVTITCVVGTSEPSSTQLLTDNSQQLVTNFQDVQNDRVVYTYGPLVPEDEGRLIICRYAGMDDTGSISVLFPAQYSLDEITRNVSEGSMLTVMLGLMANPRPTIGETTWTFNAGPLREGASVTVDSLTFDSINRAHSGLYSVSSTTSAGTSNPFSFTINVLYPPMFSADLSTGIVCVGAASPYTCAVAEGGTGTLNCAVVGNPPPMLTISGESDSISGDVATGLVTFSQATSAENGAIVDCTATNGDVTVSRSFTVYVGRGPAQPGSIVANISNNVLTVTWTYFDPENTIPLTRFSYNIRAAVAMTVIRSGTVGPSDRSFTETLSGFMGNTLYSVELSAENLLSSATAGRQFMTPDMGGGTGGGDNSGSSVTTCSLSVLLTVCLALMLRL